MQACEGLLYITRYIHQLCHPIPERTPIKRMNIPRYECRKGGINFKVVLLEVGKQRKELVYIEFTEVIIDAIQHFYPHGKHVRDRNPVRQHLPNQKFRFEMQIFCHRIILSHELITSLTGFICKSEYPSDLCLKYITFFRMIGEVVMRCIGENMEKIPHLEHEIKGRDELPLIIAFVELRN